MLGFAQASKRKEDLFVRKTTEPTVGPGSYDIRREINRSIPNPTIPRETVSKPGENLGGGGLVFKRKTYGSIKDNYETDSETAEEDDFGEKKKRMILPGPGTYLKEH